jgi:hypothetical protein
MFNIKTKKPPLGYSDLLPEGICGLMEESKSLGYFDKTQKFTKLERKKLKQLIKSKEKPIVKQKVDKNPALPFGMIATPLPPTYKPIETVRERIEKKKKTSYVPELEIDYDALELPEHVLELNTENTVKVSESLLDKISKKTEIRTKHLSRLLLTNTAPSILSYASSVNYVNAVMSDSFGIDFDEDPSLVEAIKDITMFEVLEFFIARLKIPEDRKDLILNTFIDKLTTKTVDRMETILKNKTVENKVKTLEAYMIRKSKNKGEVIRQKENITDPQDGRTERIINRPMITPKKGRRTNNE